MKTIIAREYLEIPQEADENTHLGYVVMYDDDESLSEVYYTEDEATEYAATGAVEHGWKGAVCKLVPVARVV